MPTWANKPEAVIHAELVTDPSILPDLHQFCVANPLPRWLWHASEPPYPSRNQWDFYYERGNNILVALDQDDELWGVRINSRSTHEGLWLHVRREEDALHRRLVVEGEVQPHGGDTPNAFASITHLNALSWALAGRIGPKVIPGDGQNKNVAAMDHDAYRTEAIRLFDTVYGPQYGLV